jgi:hypothetical protein
MMIFVICETRPKMMMIMIMKMNIIIIPEHECIQRIVFGGGNLQEEGREKERTMRDEQDESILYVYI